MGRSGLRPPRLHQHKTPTEWASSVLPGHRCRTSFGATRPPTRPQRLLSGEFLLSPGTALLFEYRLAGNRSYLTSVPYFVSTRPRVTACIESWRSAFLMPITTLTKADTRVANVRRYDWAADPVVLRPRVTGTTPAHQPRLITALAPSVEVTP